MIEKLQTFASPLEHTVKKNAYTQTTLAPREMVGLTSPLSWEVVDLDVGVMNFKVLGVGQRPVARQEGS